MSPRRLLLTAAIATAAAFALVPATARAAGTCTASDATSWTTCVASLEGGAYDSVAVTQRIVCSGPAACQATVWQVARPVSIYGTNAGAGFYRADTPTYPILTVARSSGGIRVSNLVFDENSALSCPAATDSTCGAAVKITDSSGVTVDGISTFHAKRAGVDVFYSSNVRVLHSRIIDSYLSGIAFRGGTGGDVIERNLVKDTGANGIVLYELPAAASTPVVVRRNVLVHNHRLNLYNQCGASGTDPCSGGQIYVAHGTTNVKIERNVVQDGSSDQLPLTNATAGIEFENHDIQSVSIANNDIHNNTMWGIYLNSNATNVSRILITRNKLYSNGQQSGYNGVDVGNFPAGVKTESENCSGSACAPQAVLAAVYADPNPCVLVPLAPTCTTTVRWYANDVSGPQLLRGGAQVATGPSGSLVTTVDADGSDFAVADGAGAHLDDLYEVAYPLSAAALARPIPAAYQPVTPPDVSLTAPADAATVTGVVTLSASASGAAGVAKVEFYVDGALAGSDTTAPYSFDWDTRALAHGSVHTVFARAYGSDGQLGVTFVRQVTVTDSTPPTVKITSPANGATVKKNTTVTITATATDLSGIAKVEFLVGTTLQCTDATAPYTCAWLVPKGASVTYTLNARGYDTIGNVGTNSVTVKSG